MSETPSKRRRRGRHAFVPGADPMDYQPYDKNKWGYDIYLKDFLDGWEEGRKIWEIEEMERVNRLEGSYEWEENGGDSND